MIAGLEDLSQGEILLEGSRCDHLLPSSRGMAMVFQSYALYPHMSVRENLRFGLVCQNVAKAEIATRIARAADILQIAHLLDRQPSQLSGGQSQRVAIGRAIVKEPKAFLFDEPLSNLDAELRVKMRSEIALLHRRLGATMIYVTHDQVEAMTMADTIVVLRDGLVEQVGSPIDLYMRPRNRFVACFLGAPQMNFSRPTLSQPRRTDWNSPSIRGAPGSRLTSSRLRRNPERRSSPACGPSTYLRPRVARSPPGSRRARSWGLKRSSTVCSSQGSACQHPFEASAGSILESRSASTSIQLMFMCSTTAAKHCHAPPSMPWRTGHLFMRGAYRERVNN